MKKTLRLTALILSITLLFSLFSCGNDNGSAGNANGYFIPRLDQRVFLNRKDERRPNRFSIGRNDRSFYFLIFFQNFRHKLTV